MRIQKALLSTAPVLFLAAACGETRTPTSPQERFGVGVTATMAIDCQAQIDALIAITRSVPILSKDPERDRAGLLKNLTDARDLLGLGKSADAVKKLSDYIVKVEQLETAGRLDAASADELIAGANGAIGCINAIGA